MAAGDGRAAPSRMVAAALWTTFVLASPGLADQISLAPTKDNTIYDDGNTLSNGAGVGLFAGVTTNGAIRRALLAFDVAAAIPAGATITSAQLVLHVTMSIAGSQTTTLHRLLAEWGEGTSDSSANGGGKGTMAAPGDATWRFRFFNTDRWATKGGDFVDTASASQSALDSGPVTWGSTAQMVADVQDWLDTPSTNFGWIVLGNEGHNTTTKRFASRESPTVALRPQLVITFQPPGGATVTPTTTAVPTATGVPTATAVPTAIAVPTETPSPTETVTPTLTSEPSPTATQTVTGTATASFTVVPTATTTATDTAAPTGTPVPPIPTATGTEPPPPTSTPTAPVAACVGDCDASGRIAINELITGVSIALGILPLDACPAFDPSGNGVVSISTLIAAVGNALNGCPT